ncbi:MAG: DUF2934 domain-containing protein [Methylosarcina sp.]
MEQKSIHNFSGEPELKEKFREMIAENAYFRAQRRGFEPGHEMEDWREAELEITNIFRDRFQQESAPEQHH